MDIIGLVGALVALLAIVFGNFLEGGSLSSLLNGPAAVIVLGGTFGAVILQATRPQLLQAIRMFNWVISPPLKPEVTIIDMVVSWAMVSRKEGLLALESLAEKEKDPLAQKGMQLLADGHDAESIKKAMMLDIEVWEQYALQGAKFYVSAGGYAPTVGIIGAVLGLIHVLSNLGEAEAMGQGIATAFVATVYGVGIANLFLLPIGNRLIDIVNRNYRLKELLMQGVIYIAEGDNPNAIRHKLTRASR